MGKLSARGREREKDEAQHEFQMERETCLLARVRIFLCKDSMFKAAFHLEIHGKCDCNPQPPACIHKSFILDFPWI